MECQFCKKMLSTKSALKVHQTKTRNCLKLQGKENIKGNFVCNLCGKDFQVKCNLKDHQLICEKNSPNILKLKEEITELYQQNQKIKYDFGILQKENEILKGELENFRSDYKDLATTAVKRPTNSTKNIQINNYIKNMPLLLESDIKENVQYLTLDHHVKGAEGYAEYALEFPFKDKIVCVDTARNKIKYKNEEGDVIDDVGFRKMMEKLCKELKDRSFNLSQEHYEKLSESFTEKEVDDYNFMETAIAISKYANGKENDFCNKIIKMISKGVIVK
jgi:regulator of replication initiation timing